MVSVCRRARWLNLLLVAGSLSWLAACGRSGLWGRDAAAATRGTGGGGRDGARDAGDASLDRGADGPSAEARKADEPGARDVPAETGRQSDAGIDRMADASPDRGIDHALDRAPEVAPPPDARRADGPRADRPPVTSPVDAAGMLSLVAGQLGSFGAHDGVGPAARFHFPSAVTSDGKGNLFVADTLNHVIRKVEIGTRKVTTVAGSPGDSGAVDGIGATARFAEPEGIAYDGAGNLLVADTLNETIRKVVVATGAVTTLAGAAGETGDADGIGASARFFGPKALAWDGAGNLFISNQNFQGLRKLVIATGEVTTVADIVPGPMALAADRAGNLFVADSSVIRKVVVATGVVTTLAGNPDVNGAADGTGTNASFGGIMSLAYDGAGSLIVADQDSSDGPKIRRVVIATGEVSTIVSQADAAKACPWQITSTGFIMVAPTLGLTSDGAGKIYAAVLYNGTLCEIDPTSKTVTPLAGAAPAPGVTDGPGSQARLDGPTGLSTDGAGNLYAIDRCGLRQIGVGSSEVTTVAARSCGRYGGGFGGFDTDTVSDGKGNLFFAGPGTIESLIVDSGVMTSVAGSRGKYGATTDGTGPDASFAAEPSSLAYDGKGVLFVAQARTTSIRKVEIDTGTVTTLVLLARTVPPLSNPAGLVYDPADALFVSDADKCAVYKVVLGTGEMTLLAGSPGDCGFADGKGATARFRGPSKMASDGAGNLYIADPDNHAVRKVALSTETVTTVVGAPELFDVVIPGALPAHLNGPSGLVYVPGLGLFIADVKENAILLAGL